MHQYLLWLEVGYVRFDQCLCWLHACRENAVLALVARSHYPLRFVDSAFTLSLEWCRPHRSHQGKRTPDAINRYLDYSGMDWQLLLLRSGVKCVPGDGKRRTA